MKKRVFIVPLMIISAVILFTTNCTDDKNEESCIQDNFCDDKDVTVCCEGDVCVYKYNGKEYPDTDAGEDQLFQDLNCTVVSLKSSDFEQEKAETLNRLRSLMEEAKIKFVY